MPGRAMYEAIIFMLVNPRGIDVRKSLGKGRIAGPSRGKDWPFVHIHRGKTTEGSPPPRTLGQRNNIESILYSFPTRELASYLID